jgi:rhodanese-related sulfurtransferase
MPIKDIDSKTLKTWLDKGEAILVDVREPSEHTTGVIPQALLIPLGNVSWHTVPAPQGKKLVMQCRSGARSQTAGHILLKENPDLEVYNLAGGILEWVASGNTVNAPC